VQLQRWPIAWSVIFLLLSSSTVRAQAQRARLPFALPLSKAPAALQARQVPEAQALTTTFTFGTIDFPNAPDSDAQAINDKNEIVGAYGGDLPDFRLGLPAYGFVQKGSSFKKIAYPSAPITVLFGVNSLGEIVGFYSLDPADNSGHGFTLVGTTYTTIDYPGAQYTALVAINKSGQMIAQGCFSGEYFCRSYLLNSGTFTQIMFPGAAGTTAYGINDAGEIVGYYSYDKVTFRGFTLTSGVWGDSGCSNCFGVVGTTDNGNSFFGKNNTVNHETLYVENDSGFSGGNTPYAARFAGPGASTYCEIIRDSNDNGTGDLVCTGSKSAAVPVDGNRMVRLYAVEAADNWFEDAGSGHSQTVRSSFVSSPLSRRPSTQVSNITPS
jgi:hypothetical protein